MIHGTIKQSINISPKARTSSPLITNEPLMKTEQIKPDVEANPSKHLQTKDNISATLKHPTKPIPKPARDAQRRDHLE